MSFDDFPLTFGWLIGYFIVSLAFSNFQSALFGLIIAVGLASIERWKSGR